MADGSFVWSTSRMTCGLMRWKQGFDLRAALQKQACLSREKSMSDVSHEKLLTGVNFRRMRTRHRPACGGRETGYAAAAVGAHKAATTSDCVSIPTMRCSSSMTGTW